MCSRPASPPARSTARGGGLAVRRSGHDDAIPKPPPWARWVIPAPQGTSTKAPPWPGPCSPRHRSHGFPAPKFSSSMLCVPARPRLGPQQHPSLQPPATTRNRAGSATRRGRPWRTGGRCPPVEARRRRITGRRGRAEIRSGRAARRGEEEVAAPGRWINGNEGGDRS